MLIIVTTVVVYTDKKGLFNPDQTNYHTSRKWNSFYDFTEKDIVDVVLVGNSHLYTGVNPKNLSAALGCNCFVLASPGTILTDSYFCLKEALTRTQPKIAIIETYGINNTLNWELKEGGLSDQLKSLNARKNIVQKLLSTPVLFTVENYLPAWSTTIRNYDFIFRDTAQLAINKKLAKNPPKKDKKLYLGRFVSFTSGIEDSTIAKYVSLGAPGNGVEREISHEQRLYTQKIVQLCEKHGVIPLFITVPMYYKHVNNYQIWRERIAAVIEPTGAPWYDLQQPYDTTVFTRDCFENTYNKNQHMTYTGSLVTAYKLAHYIVDTMQIELPRRHLTPKWHQLFYAEEGYFENFPSKTTDETNKLICQDKTFGAFYLTDATYLYQKNANRLLLKINRKALPHAPAQLYVTLRLEKDGQSFLTKIIVNKSNIYSPIAHYLYKTYLLKELKVLSIEDIQTSL